MKVSKKSNKIQTRENDGISLKAVPPVDQTSQCCLPGIHSWKNQAIFRLALLIICQCTRKYCFFLHFAVRIDIYDDWIDTLSAQKVLQHALKWYFRLFWGKFWIITSVLFLCVKFLSLLLFTLLTTMPASHLFGGKDTPCPINRTDVSYMLLHDGNPNVNRLLDFTQHLEGSGIDKMVLVEFECLSYLT